MELLVVVAIIGVGVGIVGYQSYTDLTKVELL